MRVLLIPEDAEDASSEPETHHGDAPMLELIEFSELIPPKQYTQ